MQLTDEIRGENGVNILSLFDGMACGLVAMIESGVKVNRYIAYEIDKYAVKTSQHNFHFIEHKGDVFQADFAEYRGAIDYLMGGSPCFVAGTMVKTIDGHKPIEDIEVGDLVLTHKGRYMPVTKTMNRVSPETVIIKAENCGEIECTKEHPFYAKEVYRKYQREARASNRVVPDKYEWISPEMFIKQKNSSGTVTRQTYLTSVVDHGYTKVLYDGIDVNVNQFESHHVNTLNLNNGDVWYIIGRWIGDGWFKYRYRNGKKLSGIIICCGKDDYEELEARMNASGFKYYVSEEKTTYRFTLCNVELATYLLKFGVGAENKHLTRDCYMLEGDLARAMISGYLDSDGSRDGHICTFSTTSKELAYGMKYMINKYLGVSCSISKAKDNGNKIMGRSVTTKPIYIGCFHSERQRQSHYFSDGIYIIAPYTSLDYSYEAKIVYNLSVAEDESYTANGLAVHNCTHWLICQKKNRETEANGIGWELFCQYVRALRESEPKFFIYENNKSMSNAIRESITKEFGFEPICINSALVSAQNRQRLYWVGRRNPDGSYRKVEVEQPIDRGVLLRDILEYGSCMNEVEPVNMTKTGKAQCLRATCYKDGIRNMIGNDVDRRTCVAEKVEFIECKCVGCDCGSEKGYAIPVEFNGDIPTKARSASDGKLHSVYEVCDGNVAVNGKKYEIELPDGYYIFRKLTVLECRRLQTVPDWYEFPVSDTQAYKMLGNGWTCSVISHLVNATLENK